MESIDGRINNLRVVILDVDGCRLGEQEHKTVDILTSSFDVYLHAWKKHTTTADVDRTDLTIRKETRWWRSSDGQWSQNRVNRQKTFLL
jgi:hypothetical protein